MSRLVLQPTTLTTPESGALEWDGEVPYFTPQGTQRGVVPGMQYYRLNSGVVGANATSTQNIFGVGVTLSGSTVYAFDTYYVFSKSAGGTSHTISFGYGGTATVNNILTNFISSGTGQAMPVVPVTGTTPTIQYNNTAAFTVTTGAIASAAFSVGFVVRGTVSINAGGTFVPQYQLSAAPGGAYTTQTGSYFLIYPIGAAGTNTSVGTWA